MNLQDAIYELYGKLLPCAFFNIEDSYFETIHRATVYSKKRTPEEPDYIATLVTKTIPDIAVEWGKVLSTKGIALSVASVFCHQRPIVTYSTATKNPELGDLLIVHVHHPKKGRVKRQALLLQAKMANDLSMGIGAGDRHQYELYNSWPKFTYVKPKKSAFRDVKPKRPHEGARYLLLLDQFFYTSPPREVLHYEKSLALELTQMLTFESGKGFIGRSAAQKRKDWSTVVWDLLEMSFNKNFRRTNTGHSKHPRVVGMTSTELFCLGTQGSVHTVLSELVGKEDAKYFFNSGDNGGDVNFPVILDSDEGGGISTVLIETRELDKG